jgi:hypothetical protein
VLLCPQTDPFATPFVVATVQVESRNMAGSGWQVPLDEHPWHGPAHGVAQQTLPPGNPPPGMVSRAQLLDRHSSGDWQLVPLVLRQLPLRSQALPVPHGVPMGAATHTPPPGSHAWQSPQAPAQQIFPGPV